MKSHPINTSTQLECTDSITISYTYSRRIGTWQLVDSLHSITGSKTFGLNKNAHQKLSRSSLQVVVHLETLLLFHKCNFGMLSRRTVSGQQNLGNCSIDMTMN